MLFFNPFAFWVCVLQEIKLERVRADDKLGLILCDGLPVNRTTADSSKSVNAASPERRGATEETAQVDVAVQQRPDADDVPDVEEVDEEDSEVYIQAIAAESLAAADGRLSQGDLLLQVC